jgi:chloramphenicol-sensitive protein RarD
MKNPRQHLSREQVGLIAGGIAFPTWGLMGLYFGLLKPAQPLEVIAYRVVTGWVALLVVMMFLGQLRGVRVVIRDRRQILPLTTAGLLIAANWAVYVWSVQAGRLVEAGLGFFLQPLISVLLAVIVLKERPRRLQWVAVSAAGIGMTVMTIGYGRPPWIAFVLGGSLSAYGLLRKRANTPAFAALFVETNVQLLPALGILTWLDLSGRSTLTSAGGGHTALLLGVGIVTGAPMLLFGVALQRVPLTTLSIMQYANPTVTVIVGVWVLGEKLTPDRIIGLGFVCVALGLLAADAFRAAPAQTPAPVQI